MVLNTNGFICKLASVSGYTKKECEQIVQSLTLLLCDALSNGDTIKLHGLLEIGIRRQDGRDVPHPVTKEIVHVRPMTLPYLKFGKLLLDSAKANLAQDEHPRNTNITENDVFKHE